MGRTKKVPSKPRGVALLKDYQRTFGSPSGKKVLYDLMKNHYVLSSTLIGWQRAEEVFIREGERNVVLGLLTKLKTDAEAFEKMLEQEAEREGIYDDGY